MEKDLIISYAIYVKDSKLNIYTIDVLIAIEKSAPFALKKTLMQQLTSKNQKLPKEVTLA